MKTRRCWVFCACLAPQISLSRYWWVTTRPECSTNVVSSLYSMGVKWTSASRTKTRRAAISTVKPPHLNTGVSLPFCLSAACRNATRIARQQFAGAEWLGQVIVGPVIEGAIFCTS